MDERWAEDGKIAFLKIKFQSKHRERERGRLYF